MKVLGVIPARYASTRFPGKPLVVIDGKSMIQRVYEQASSCTALTEIIVATDNESIRKHVEQFGGNSVMTGDHHRSGTERCNEVYEKISDSGWKYNVIVNIQGDEPYIHPEQIFQVVSCFEDREVMIASLMKRITSNEELIDPNVVKVLTGINGNALYFSRTAIPFVRGRDVSEWLDHASFFKHIGIYGYRPEVLAGIVKLSPSPLEQSESLEQLRWLENGFRIKMKETCFESTAIDIPADLLKLTNRK
jgi:3-deoxy-manno-octulosonate cytidylyltransferase (CMP-KDO synthetase)